MNKLIQWPRKLLGAGRSASRDDKQGTSHAPVRGAEIITPIQAIESGKPAAYRTEGQRSEFYRLGKEIAGNSRGQKFDAAIWEALRDYVEAQVTLGIVPNFDAVGDRVDGRVLARLEALDEELQNGKEAAEMAGAEFLRRKAERTSCGCLPSYPSASPVFRWTATGTLSFSIAPTIYCYFTGLFPTLKWVLSGGFAFAAALLIVTAILPDEPAPHRNQAQSKEVFK